MKRINSLLVWLGMVPLINACSVNLLPPLESPQALTLNIASLEKSGLGKKFTEVDPVYLSGVFVSQPYRSSKIYSCENGSGLTSSGYEWLGSFESQLESELDRVLREVYPSVRFVSKESGAFSKSELSLKVYKFCLNEFGGERELTFKMLVTFTPYAGKEQTTKLFDLSFKDDSASNISQFIDRGFGSFIGALFDWLDTRGN